MYFLTYPIYSADMVELFTEVYNWLPLAHLINNKVMVGYKHMKMRVLSLPSVSDCFPFIILFLNYSHFNTPCVDFQVMHGGLFSRDDVTLDEIRKIERNRQPPEQG